MSGIPYPGGDAHQNVNILAEPGDDLFLELLHHAAWEDDGLAHGPDIPVDPRFLYNHNDLALEPPAPPAVREQARRPGEAAAAPYPAAEAPLNGRDGHQPQSHESQVQAPAAATDNDELHSQSVEACLSKVLELFPDICHKFVGELCASQNAGELYRHGDLSYVESVIEDILSKPSYPKEKKGSKRRRPVEESSDDTDLEDDAAQGDASYTPTALKMLTREFPHVPSNYIRQILAEKRKLHPTYLFLVNHENSEEKSAKPYDRLKRPRRSSANDPDVAHMNGQWSVADTLKQELNSAKAKAEKEAENSRKKKEHEEAERLNEEEHTRAGTLVECQCCYLDNAANRTMSCEEDDPHLFCYTCIRTSAETQIGLMKYELKCFDTGGCQAGFSRRQLRDVLGDATMDKLDSLQQEDEIRRACPDGLEGCPFCDFKAICPPVEENREFRCFNPECEIVSCRLCNQETHVPKTCQETKRERGVSERHLVEEAMSEAYIRPCPRCKLKIVKEVGCNKMTCPKCYCMMCYVCKKDITREGYEHFGRRQGACRVEDDPRQKHMHQEVDRAEEAAIERIKAEKPDLSYDDLLVNRPGQERAPRQPPRRPVGRDDLVPMRYALQDVYRYEMQQMAQPIFPDERLPYPEFLLGQGNMDYGQMPLPGGNIAMPPAGNYPNINVNVNVPYGGPAPAPMIMHNGRLARPPAYAGSASSGSRTGTEPACDRSACGHPASGSESSLANHQYQPPLIDLTEPAAHDYSAREVRR
ncbi:Ring finger protein [Aspergillus sp. HF37]|nr:Ring finger protein [Aspergillus sp. HF37]